VDITLGFLSELSKINTRTQDENLSLGPIAREIYFHQTGSIEPHSFASQRKQNSLAPVISTHGKLLGW